MLSTCIALLAGQSEPPKATNTDDGDLLRGPAVPDKAMQTLINTDMGGKFIPIQGRPANAALELIIVDPERRASARQMAQERRVATGMLLVENIDLVKEASDANRAGDNKKSRDSYIELYKIYNPENVRDPLLNAWQDILSEKEFKQIKQMVDEYWEALINWEMRNTKNRTDEVRTQTERRLSFQLFQREIGEAFTWSLRPTQQRLESIYQAVEPTEELRQAIREVMIDFIREAKLNPTAEQRQTAATRIYELLDEEQRLKLFSQALWQF